MGRLAPALLASTVFALVLSGALIPPRIARAQDTPLPIEPADLTKLARVLALELSPDGTEAVAEVRRILGDALGAQPKARYVSELWRYAVDQPGPGRRLTDGERSASQPAISPDGSWLAFVRLGDGKEGETRPQVWLLPLDGPGEARQLSHLEHGADEPRWFPDSQSLLITSALPASKLSVPAPFLPPARGALETARRTPAAEVKESSSESSAPPADEQGWARWLAQREQAGETRHLDRRAFVGELDLAGELEIEGLVRIDLAGKTLREWRAGWLGTSQAQLSPDGGSVVFRAPYPLDVHPDQSDYHALFLWRLAAAEPEALLVDERWDLGDPCWADDGGQLFFTLQPTLEPNFGQTRLGRLELTSGNLSMLADDIDAPLSTPTDGGGGILLFQREFEGRKTLMGLDLETGQHRPLVDAAGTVQRFASRGGRIVYALSTAQDPAELYRFEASGDDPRLSELNRGFLGQHSISEPAWHWLERPDAARVQYWVQPPLGRSLESLTQGAKVPVVLEVHGGPQVMWSPGTESMWHEFQLLSARGYAVVYANPRGSSGYGREFQRGNYRDWGPGPSSDVLAALDDALALYPALDEGRLFLTGGSYGGYLTAWIVAHDARFQAAVAQRGVYDLETFFGEGNAFRLVKYAFGGWPFEPGIREILTAQSPLTHVQGIRTPLLILHGSNDLRTGVSQSQMLFRSLELLGRPVEYVRYPEAGHELSRSGDPAQRIDRLVRILEWFERHDPGAGDAVELAPAPEPEAQPEPLEEPAVLPQEAPQEEPVLDVEALDEPEPEPPIESAEEQPDVTPEPPSAEPEDAGGEPKDRPVEAPPRAA